MLLAASMTVVPGFTTTSRPSTVPVTNPGFLGGGGAGGPAGLGGGGASIFFSSAISSPCGLLLHLAADHVDAVEGGDQVGEERAGRQDRERGQHRPAPRAQPPLVRPPPPLPPPL